MQTNNSTPRPDAMQHRFGLLVGSMLDASAERIPADIDQRLRAIRFQALQRQPKTASGWTLLSWGRGSAALGAERPGWRLALGLALAVPVLVLGLRVAQVQQQETSLHQIADIDTALLLDDLPPQAYLDPGFKRYLGQAG